MKNGRYVHEALSGVGSVGCYMAHYNLWKLCVEQNKEIAVFEDDFELLDDNRIEIIQKSYREATQKK